MPQVKTLLTKLIKKRDQYFRSLVDTWHQELYMFGYWLSGDPCLTVKLVEETFIIAFEIPHRLGANQVSRYFLASTFYEQYSHQTKNPIRGHLQQKSTVISDTKSDDFQKQLWSLEEKYRTPLIMQTLLKLDIDEIAQILKLERETIQNYLISSRTHLKENQIQRENNHAIL